MKTIFEKSFSSRTGLEDIGVQVDPYTGKCCTHIPVVSRYPNGPIIDKNQFLDSVQEQMLDGCIQPEIKAPLDTLTDCFNPGIAHYKGKYVMLVRSSNTARIQELYLAESEDAIHWTHHPIPIHWPDFPMVPKMDVVKELKADLTDEQDWHSAYYDPRITQMDTGEYLITLAVDYDTVQKQGGDYFNVCDNILYTTRDFKTFEFMGTITGHTRNAVLFPRKINGFYYAAARSNAGNQVDTVLLRSTDKVNWELDKDLFSTGHGWMCSGGPGFPPFETKDYWVFGVHGIEMHGQHRVHYRAGVCLLNKETLELIADPAPILDPTELYELTGIVDNVIFPTGLLFSDGLGCGIKTPETKIALYYGGADRVIHCGLTTAGRLIDHAIGNYNPFSVQ